MKTLHHLGYCGRFRVYKKINIFKNYGVSMNDAASNVRRLQAGSRYASL